MKQILHRVDSLICTPIFMAFYHSRLSVENKINRAEFFACDKFTLKNLAHKSGCVQTNLLYFLYITSVEKEYYEALFLSYRPRTNCSSSQFFKTNCIHSIQDHQNSLGLLAKPFKKFPESRVRPDGSNFWQAPNLERNFKRVTLPNDKVFIVFIFY